MHATRSYELTILTVPGTRKSSQETAFPELGEDAAGAKVIRNHVIAWVADGAPGPVLQEPIYDENGNFIDQFNPVGPQFGSRTLARCLGEAFTEAVREQLVIHGRPLAGFNEKEISKRVMNSVRRLMARRLLQFVPFLAKMDLPRDASGSYMLEWSASFIGTVISLEDASALIYSTGDCLAFVITEKEKSILGGNLVGRFFCRWKCTPEELREELYHMKIIKGKTTFAQVAHVHQLALMSDGVASKKDLIHIQDVTEIDKFCRSTDDDRTLLLVILDEG